jgi:hypothetical protein
MQVIAKRFHFRHSINKLDIAHYTSVNKSLDYLVQGSSKLGYIGRPENIFCVGSTKAHGLVLVSVLVLARVVVHFDMALAIVGSNKGNQGDLQSILEGESILIEQEGFFSNTVMTGSYNGKDKDTSVRDDLGKGHRLDSSMVRFITGPKCKLVKGKHDALLQCMLLSQGNSLQAIAALACLDNNGGL